MLARPFGTGGQAQERRPVKAIQGKGLGEARLAKGDCARLVEGDEAALPICSMAWLCFAKTPGLAALPMAATTAVGVARTEEHGQVTTSTVIERITSPVRK